MDIHADIRTISMDIQKSNYLLQALATPDNSRVNEMSTGDNTEKKRPPRFLLAMPEHIRVAIEKEAFINHRTVTAEINSRLVDSLKGHKAGDKPPPVYITKANEESPAGAISDTDQAMLEIFRKLPPEKQLALLSLFR